MSFNSENNQPPDTLHTEGEGRIATVGTFDGVHTGHIHLLTELKEHGRRLGLRPTAIVLDTHPLRIVRSAAAPPELSEFAERKEAIEAYGVEVFPLSFNEHTRSETSEQFIERMRDEMGIKALLIGHDNRFGSDRENGLPHYMEAGRRHGVKIIEATCLPGVSSSAVRKLLIGGNIEEGNRLLGRAYSFAGTVCHGAKLGHTIGFPTANLIPLNPGVLIPAPGVYATLVSTDEKGVFRHAMTNIGYRPTVAGENSTLSIETHIFDFAQEIYGHTIRLHFIARLRNEERFSSVDSLAAQLRKDALQAREILTSRRPLNSTYLKKL